MERVKKRIDQHLPIPKKYRNQNPKPLFRDIHSGLGSSLTYLGMYEIIIQRSRISAEELFYQ